jgi:hypothetical protein
MFTIIGIPVALGVLLLLLPGLAAVGYLVAGAAVGGRLLELARTSPDRRSPHIDMVIGLMTLVLLGALPIVGFFVGLTATFLGGGAIALTAYRTLRGRQREPGAPGNALPFGRTAQPGSGF